MLVYKAKDAAGQLVTLTPGVPFATYDHGVAIQHAPDALAHYSDADLARFGITRSEEPDPIPVRRELTKSTLMQRLNAIGKLQLAFNALMSEPLQFGLWFAPDWPNVYADDADLLTMLHAIGCTDAEIAQVTA